MSDEDPRVVWQRACDALGELPETVSAEDAGEACMRAARELLALSRRLAGVACDACRGLGDRIYPTTATWHGGAGGATPTLGVCDRCWRSGRQDQRGPDLRAVAASERARLACQTLVAEIGADGPAAVDAVAERAAATIRDLRDQVADLLAAQDESEHAVHMRVRAGYDKTIADTWRKALAEVESERDEARAETARLASQLESISFVADQIALGALQIIEQKIINSEEFRDEEV